MPKKDRFTIGQKTDDLMLEILVSLVSAYHLRDPNKKLDALNKANISLECLKILFRLAKDTHALEKRWYIKYEEQLQEIGRMLGGWMSSTSKTNR